MVMSQKQKTLLLKMATNIPKKHEEIHYLIYKFTQAFRIKHNIINLKYRAIERLTTDFNSDEVNVGNIKRGVVLLERSYYDDKRYFNIIKNATKKLVKKLKEIKNENKKYMNSEMKSMFEEMNNIFTSFEEKMINNMKIIDFEFMTKVVKKLNQRIKKD